MDNISGNGIQNCLKVLDENVINTSVLVAKCKLMSESHRRHNWNCLYINNILHFF